MKYKQIDFFSLWKYWDKLGTNHFDIFSINMHHHTGWDMSIVLLNFGITIRFYNHKKAIEKFLQECSDRKESDKQQLKRRYELQ